MLDHIEAEQSLHQEGLADLLGKPHVVSMTPTTDAVLDAEDFSTFWREAELTMARIAQGLGHSLDDVAGWAAATTAVPFAFRDDAGTLLATGLIRELCIIPDAAPAVVAMVAVPKVWPNLRRLEFLLEAVAEEAGAGMLVMWSPDPLPPLPGWSLADFSGLPPFHGPALARFVDVVA